VTILRTCERLCAKPDGSVWTLPLLFDGKKFVYQLHVTMSSSTETDSSSTIVDKSDAGVLEVCVLLVVFPI